MPDCQDGQAGGEGFVLLAGTTLVAASAHAEDPAAFCLVVRELRR